MATSTDTTFTINTLPHMIPIKLSSNYLFWRNQMLFLFSYQQLSAHIDGSSEAPPTEIKVEDKLTPNPAYATWFNLDQRSVILLNSSLTEEATSEVLGLSTALSIWLALENAYSSSSVARIHSLHDNLRNITKGTYSVPEYSRKFKVICDQLSAIAQPVEDIDKLHWYLCGLGPSFETFSTAIRTTKPPPIFCDLVAQVEAHEIFLQSLHGSSTPPAAFISQNSRFNNNNNNRGRGQTPSRGGYRGASNSGRGRWWSSASPLSIM